MDNLKIRVNIINKKLTKCEYRDITIKCLGIQHYGQFNENQDIFYEYSIPNYIYDALVDTEPEFISKDNFKKLGNDSHTAHHKGHFKKLIKTTSINDIIKTIQRYSSIIEKNNNDRIGDRIKKIFINFKGGTENGKSAYNHTHMGKITSTVFQFFVGYEVTEETGIFKTVNIKNYKTNIVNRNGEFIDRWKYEAVEIIESKPDYSIYTFRGLGSFYYIGDRDSFLNKYTIVDWTQEREDFLLELQTKFINLNDRLNTYLGELNEDKLDLLMTSNYKLLKGE